MLLRYSLRTLLLLVAFFAILFVLSYSQIVFESHSGLFTRSNDQLTTIVQFGYRTDRLGIRNTYLDYVVLTIYSNSELKEGVPAAVTQGAQPRLKAGTQSVRLPSATQIFEVRGDHIVQFPQRITYSEFHAFLSTCDGPFSAKDIIQWIRNRDADSK